MNGTKNVFRLSDFDISDKTGFLPPIPPLKRLPGDYFSTWEDTCANVPTIIKEGKLRSEVDSLPERYFTNDTLKSEEEWRRAYVLLVILSQAYIWAEGEAGLIDRLQKKLAVPWCAVADHVNLKPVATYAGTAMYNYGLRDPKGRMDADNMYAVSTYTGTEDESWFYMVPALIELDAVPGLKAIEHSFHAMDKGQTDALTKDLQEITKAIQAMSDTLERMYERCAPLTFYLEIRPFQSGSKGLKAFPDGIIYEGVDTEPRQYHGASAAQNTSVPTFDVFLRAKHAGDEQEFLQTMREYVPKKHREFLEALEQQPSVREYAAHSKDPELIKSYNDAVEAFGSFRSGHFVMVTRYIVNQRRHSVNASLDMTGTGGTPFMKFLKQVRDDTVALKIGCVE